MLFNFLNFLYCFFHLISQFINKDLLFINLNLLLFAIFQHFIEIGESKYLSEVFLFFPFIVNLFHLPQEKLFMDINQHYLENLKDYEETSYFCQSLTELFRLKSYLLYGTPRTQHISKSGIFSNVCEVNFVYDGWVSKNG